MGIKFAFCFWQKIGRYKMRTNEKKTAELMMINQLINMWAKMRNANKRTHKDVVPS